MKVNIAIIELADKNFEIQVISDKNDDVDVYTTTSPQRTIVKILRDLNVKGKRGAPIGWNRPKRGAEIPAVTAD